MPEITAQYKPPLLFRNGHVATIYSGLFRKVHNVNQQRERITTQDGDFLDLDWSYAAKKTHTLVILLHGLEGNAQRPYMLGAAKILNTSGIDAVGVNLRGCSGEDNKKYRSYNSGATEDLIDVIAHILETKHYTNIHINGFSLGGNLVLKYLGEEGSGIPGEIKSVVAISVPCFLYGSMLELHKFKNAPYAFEFLRHLKRKLKRKQQHFPDMVSGKQIASIKTLKDFDDVYTSKAHGYKDALDYYEQCSSLQFLKNIRIPTLILNAKNDSFLSPECYPVEAARSNSCLFLEMPKFGGHVGFIQQGQAYYNEVRALEFFNDFR